jgi:hypothetical protein
MASGSMGTHALASISIDLAGWFNGMVQWRGGSMMVQWDWFNGTHALASVVAFNGTHTLPWLGKGSASWLQSRLI